MALTPIRRVGSTSLYYVAQADFIGVEVAPTGSTDHRGFNEALDWTVRLGDVLEQEHYTNGVHSTLRIPRAIVVGGYHDVLGYSEFWGSYVQSTAGAVTYGNAAVTLAAGGGAGQITVTLATAMPSSTYRVVDMAYGGSGNRVFVNLTSITSTTVFSLTRWEGGSFSTAAATHGDFAVAVYDG
jgi:hypothetical protein